MAKDAFNENDLADVNSTTPAPSDTLDLTPEAEANINAAINKFFEKAPDEVEIASEKVEAQKATTGEGEKVADEIAKRRLARNRASRKEQDQELRDEGLLEDEDGVPAEKKPVEDKGKIEPKVEAEKPAEQPVAAPTDIDPTLRYFAETELGWSKEKLDRLVKADPEIATETITNLADTYTNLSRQYLTGSQVAPGTQVEQPAQTEDAPLTPQLDKFYTGLTDFVEANGDDLGQFVTALKSELIDPVKQIFAENKVREQEMNRSEALTTFSELTEKFSDIYGKAGVAPTPEQAEAKRALGELADQLREGAKRRGQKLSIKSAMRQAHLNVSAPFRAAIERQKITEQVHKREKAITAKPSQRLVPATSGKSDASAEEAIAKFAAERGIDWLQD